MLETQRRGAVMRWMLVGVNEGDNTRAVDIVTVLPPKTSCAVY